MLSKQRSTQQNKNFDTVHIIQRSPWFVLTMTLVVLLGSALVFLAFQFILYRYGQTETARMRNELQQYHNDVYALEHEDQRLLNKRLTQEIDNIHATYETAVRTYEELIRFRELSKDTIKQDQLFVDALTLLSQKNYATATGTLSNLRTSIGEAKAKIQLAGIPSQNVSSSNTPPSSGYSRQAVTVDSDKYVVDMVAGDLGSTRVIVDTASDADCHNDCPVLALGEYVARNNAYAGVNGSYFCPAEYPSCAGKKNSFDTLLMNKKKTYFNSDNNVYSVVPLVVFSGNSVRFIGRSLDWGRDTSPDSLIANQPLLVSGGTVAFGGDDDPKKGSKGTRSFVANKGATVYIGVVHSVTVAGAARALKALGFDNALNLDSGGSTALWSNGYKAGPGRNIPNAILFVRK